MTESELDQCYTELCQALSRQDTQGRQNTELGLARFALLAMLEINEPAKVRSLIHRAILDPSFTLPSGP